LKKILSLLIVFSMLTISMIVFPVAADNSKKIPVTFTRTGVFLVTGDHWFSTDITYHLRDTTVGYTTYAIAGQGISYTGDSEGKSWSNLHDVHIEGSNTVGSGTSTTDSQISFADGTFEGIIQVKGTFRILPESSPVNHRGYTQPVNVEFKGIWHGTGIYTGQTLILEYTVVNGIAPSVITGTLLIP
jgi:hypothetical protein